MLKVGDQAPDIPLRTDAGEEFQLSDLKGKRVVLYFYPRADTPGCTEEACEFRDGMAGNSPKKGAAVVGVSPDKPAAQAKFKEKYDLPFTLLADEEKAAAQAYGVWKEKNMYGKKVMGIERTTFVIGAGWQDREDLRQGEGQGPRGGRCWGKCRGYGVEAATCSILRIHPSKWGHSRRRVAIPIWAEISGPATVFL